MKIKKLCTVVLLLFLSFYAKAQNWQAYKGVWLKGYDNAPQAPLPPSGYSALTYFADSLGTYVYDWDSLAWLRIPGAGGGGGGGLTTASNMLSVSPAGNVISGGTATHNTYNHLGTNAITWSSPTAKIYIPRRETVFPFTQNLYITVGDTTDSPVNNNARLILQDIPVDIPTAELRAGGGESNSGRIIATPTSASMQINNTGQTHVTVGTSQSTIRNTNIALALTGSNHRADLSSFAGRASLRTTLNTTEVLSEVTTSADNLRLTTASGSIVLDDDVLLPDVVENSSLTDSVLIVDGTGKIFWKTISGGGGGITNTSAINELPKTIDGSGNLATSGIESTTAGSLNLGLSGTSGASRTIAFQGTDTNGQIIIQAKGAAGNLRVNNTAGGGRLFVGNTAGANDNIVSVEDSGGSISLSTEHGLGSYPSQLALRGDTDDLMIHAGSGAQLNILSSGGGIINIDAGTGTLQILNIPTVDPCGSAPSGTVWNNSGVLNICP